VAQIQEQTPRNPDKARNDAARKAPPCALVIFGAGGDLTKRLLMPALYNLAGMGLLDEGMKILGVDRAESSDDAWRQSLTETMQTFTKDKTAEFYTEKIDDKAWGWVTSRLTYLQGDLTELETYAEIGRHVGDGNCIFYCAVAARFFGPVVEALGQAKLVTESANGFRRVVIEKPFGHDLASAEALDKQVLGVLGEDQVFRIDHFMGKEMVQNIMALRFANGMFEPVWKREYIDHVQIMAAETIGVEGRGSFYETTGALRDMVPNHLFTLLAMTAMEAPNSYSPDAVHGEKAKVIEAIKRMKPEDAVRGQYTAGTVLGQPVKGYRESPNVSPTSLTETYVALKLEIDNWRWAGVPFYLRTGKALAARHTQIVVHFRDAPMAVFGDAPAERMVPNMLTLSIEPHEHITIRMNVKTPGVLPNLSGTDMTFRYEDHFPMPSRVGYETLFYACLMGETTLFQRADYIEAGWAAVQPALDAWAASSEIPSYAAGSQGPAEADALMARDGRAWEELS
jgi:glucose-6-phosphate 1-dehydrogenase